MSIDADEQSLFVLGINNARSVLTDIAGQHLVPLEFISDTSGGLLVTLNGVNTSVMYLFLILTWTIQLQY